MVRPGYIEQRSPGSGEMDEQLRALGALAKDLSSVLSIRVRQLAATCNSCSRGPNARRQRTSDV